jgi:hypothetical protein
MSCILFFIVLGFVIFQIPKLLSNSNTDTECINDYASYVESLNNAIDDATTALGGMDNRPSYEELIETRDYALDVLWDAQRIMKPYCDY